MERRTFLKLSTAATFAGVLLPFHNPEYVPQDVQRPEVLGMTISQRQCDLLGFPKDGFKFVFHRLLDKLDPDIVRLCVYWDEFEDESPERIDYAVNHLEKIGKKFMLVFGAKTPRFEEIHPPKRIKEHLGNYTGKNLGEDKYFADEILKFDEQVLLRFRDCTNLEYLQGENEALDPLWLTKGAVIGEELAAKTANLIMQLRRPRQKILSTNSLPLSGTKTIRSRLLFNSSISDAVGLNIYGKVPNKVGGYDRAGEFFWRDTHDLINELMQLKPALEIWCSELQAEPWEQGANEEIIPVHTDKRFYSSSNPRQSLNLLDQTVRTGIRKTLVWGGEYWVFQEMRGYSEWMKAYESIFQKRAA